MPLPLIPIGAAAFTAWMTAHGLKKGMEAKHDMDRAKSMNSEAQRIADTAKKKIEYAQTGSKNAVEKLGKQKITVLGESMNDFVKTFEKIKNIDFQDSIGMDELRKFNPQSEEFKQLKKVTFEAKDIVVNGFSSLGGGALLAFGTYNVVMGGAGGLLVTATTGTTLASLSGAAATNATLAWLGGGALSAGGLGMAGGMAVLGGLVVGPALALGGSLLAKKAEKAFWDARNNVEEACKFDDQALSICSTLSAIEKRADQLRELLVSLDAPFSKLVSDMRSIVRNQGPYWTNYSRSDQHRIYKCAQTAIVIKMILDTSLLSEDGKLLSASEQSLNKGRNFLATLSA